MLSCDCRITSAIACQYLYRCSNPGPNLSSNTSLVFSHSAHVAKQRSSAELASIWSCATQDQLTHWRAKIQSNGRECEDRNASLANEKKVMAHHYQQLKFQMDAFRSALGERLKQLSASAKACEDALRTRLAKAEALLKLAERCRKLETEQAHPCWPFGRFACVLSVPTCFCKAALRRGAARRVPPCLLEACSASAVSPDTRTGAGEDPRARSIPY
jgi:hypothetical protein